MKRFFPAIILGVSLTVFTAISINAHSDTSTDAIKTALEATYIQAGWKEDVDNYGKCLEKRYIKKDNEKWWAAFLYVANSVVHSEVEVKWTF